MSKINVTEVSDEDLSPADIEAQIDANMSSAVSKKTEVKVEAKPVAKTETPKVQKSVPKTADVKPKVEEITKTEPTVVSHRGKILNPADATKDAQVDMSGDKKSKTDEPEEEKLEVKVENNIKAEDEPKKAPLAPAQEVNDESAPVAEKLGSISEEIKDAEAKKEEANEAKRLEEFPPEIIDTKQYHLPIKTSNRRGKNSVSLTTVLFLVFLLVVALAYVAADKEIYDPGIKLPYNFF